MRIKISILVALALFSWVGFLTHHVQAQGVNTHILVKFKANVSPDIQSATLFENGADIRETIKGKSASALTRHLNKINAQIVSVPEARKNALLEKLSKNFLVEYAEPDFQAEKTGTTNDPSLPQEWGMYKTQVTNAVNASAWDTTTGNSAVKVAVLDTGIDQTHPEFAGQITDSSNFTTLPTSADGDGHGTHVAGVIGAVGNNNTGIAGIQYSGKLMIGKVLDNNGSGYYSWIASGIIWATDNGAKVINMSLGGSSNSSTLSNAVTYARSKGVVITAAAGNNGTQAKFYPAAYTGVISVGATDENDVKPYWSNYGTWVQVAAPGTNIYSTYKNGGYQTMQGTSMATPFVAGEAALIWSTGQCANSLCVEQTIINTTDTIAGSGAQVAYGRINVLAAVQNVVIEPTATPTLIPTATPTTIPTSTPLPTSMPTMAPTSAPTSTPAPTGVNTKVLHVASIDGSYTKSGPIYTVLFKVNIKDAQNNAINGSKVSVSLTTPSGTRYASSGTTNQSGQYQYSLPVTQKGNYTFVVNSATKSGYTFDSVGNSKILSVQ